MRFDFTNMPREEEFQSTEEWVKEFSIWFDIRANNPKVSQYKELAAGIDIPYHNNTVNGFEPPKLWKDDEELVWFVGDVIVLIPPTIPTGASVPLCGPIPAEYEPFGSLSMDYASQGTISGDIVALSPIFPIIALVHLTGGGAPGGDGWYANLNTIFQPALVNNVLIPFYINWPHKEIVS